MNPTAIRRGQRWLRECRQILHGQPTTTGGQMKLAEWDACVDTAARGAAAGAFADGDRVYLAVSSLHAAVGMAMKISDQRAGQATHNLLTACGQIGMPVGPWPDLFHDAHSIDDATVELLTYFDIIDGYLVPKPARRPRRRPGGTTP
jgi:hypothetical protein